MEPGGLRGKESEKENFTAQSKIDVEVQGEEAQDLRMMPEPAAYEKTEE